MLRRVVTHTALPYMLCAHSNRHGEAIKWPEMTGEVLHIQGKRVAVSGAGNVSIYAVEKCLELGATVLTVSDSKGYIYESEGISKELLDHINDVKVAKRGSLSDVKVTSNGACRPPEHAVLCIARSKFVWLQSGREQHVPLKNHREQCWMAVQQTVLM